MTSTNRREFLKQGVATLTVMGGVGCLTACDGRDNQRADNTPKDNQISGSELAIVITGAKSFLSGKWQTVDVGVTDAGTIEIGGELNGRTIIDAAEKVISPGFIDVLGDNLSDTFEVCERYKLTDGVTTSLEMHGGSSDIANYYQSKKKQPHWVNYGASTFALRIRRQVKTLAERLHRAEACLEAGALGISYGIEYLPIPYSELLEYAKLGKKYDRPYFLHLRHSSKENELDGVKEAVRLAKDSGVHVHVDHLHSTGGTFHMKEALELIRAAIASGLRMTCCIYPYSHWATYVASKRFSEGWQKRYGITYSDLTVVGTGEKLTQKTFEKYRKGVNVLVAVPEGTMPFADTIDLALKEDFCMIGSDGGIEREPNPNNHPRGAGCFATALRHGMDIGIPLEKMLEKMTTLPRSILLPAMNSRGLLEKGAQADLVVFDPKTVRSPATVAKPNQYSIGIDTKLPQKMVNLV